MLLNLIKYKLIKYKIDIAFCHLGNKKTKFSFICFINYSAVCYPCFFFNPKHKISSNYDSFLFNPLHFLVVFTPWSNKKYFLIKLTFGYEKVRDPYYRIVVDEILWILFALEKTFHQLFTTLPRFHAKEQFFRNLS